MIEHLLANAVIDASGMPSRSKTMTPTRRFALSTDEENNFARSCTYSYKELLAGALEDEERRLLHSLEVGQKATYTSDSGQSIQYRRVS